MMALALLSYMRNCYSPDPILADDGSKLYLPEVLLVDYEQG